MAGLLQNFARRKRIEFFMPHIRSGDRILEIGAANGWFGKALTEQGFTNYTSLDLFPPADIVGDIKEWRKLGLAPQSFDVIVAFEIVEHVDCFAECHDLLAPDGRMLITTPVPEFDWVMKILETLGLNQKRTSPHSNLVDLQEERHFPNKNITRMMGLGQWAILSK